MPAGDVTAFIRQLRRAGYQVEQNRRSCHWRVMKNGETVTTLAATPSSPRWRDNAKRDIRHYEKEKAEAK